MITLTKDKIIYTNHFNPECDEYVKKRVYRLCPYLNETVELSKDFTFGDLFKIIEREVNVFDVIFSSHLGHHSLQLWTDEIKKPGPEKDDEIDYLEVYRYGEYWGKDDDHIELSVGFSGVSNNLEDPSYGLGFTPLNKLKHLPLRLNEDFEISEVKIPPRIVLFLVRLLKKIGIPIGKWDNPFNHTYIKGKTQFSVYELISAILYEISFYGDPEKRDSKIDELDKMVDEIKNGDLSNFTKWEG